MGFFSQIFEIEFFTFVGAVCKLVHDVETVLLFF